MTKLSNVKEKAMNILEKNRYVIKYGACCAGCAIVGYALGKCVATKRAELAIGSLVVANPKIIEEIKIAQDTLTNTVMEVNKL